MPWKYWFGFFKSFLASGIAENLISDPSVRCQMPFGSRELDGAGLVPRPRVWQTWAVSLVLTCAAGTTTSPVHIS